jgi:recombination protein RecR
MNAPQEPLARLVEALGHLPGIGRRSAERIALRLARETEGLLPELIAALQEVREHIAACVLCGAVTDKEHNPCYLCSDPRRDTSALCVVEDPSDIPLIERARAFRGRYFALMNKLSPMQGGGIPDARIQRLLQRIESERIQEVILALGTDVESDATIAFLRQVLARVPVKVTRIAFGIPAGSEIAYADPVTLARAIEGRTRL